MEQQESVVRWVDPAHLGRLLGGEVVSSLDYLGRIADGSLPPAPAIAMTGARLTAVETGRVGLAWQPELMHCNAMRQVHGGVIATLLDSAIGYAVVSTLALGQGFSTLQLNVNYLRPLRPDSGAAEVTGRVIRKGRRIVVAEAALHGADGKLCANASATCLPGT